MKVGAFEGDEELSPLGYHLAKLPVDVLIGKVLQFSFVYTYIFISNYIVFDVSDAKFRWWGKGKKIKL